MFSYIFSWAVASVNISIEDDEEDQINSGISSDSVTNNDDEDKNEALFRQNLADEHHHQSSSLLSILDDKNRTISMLKKQLQNQKVQLNYYIRRDLSRNKIKELSESCTPQASEDSLPLNLAINKFCRQTGIKTKLLLLHDKMNDIEIKISNTLCDQEFILRKIVNKICELVKIQEKCPSEFRNYFAEFISDPFNVNLFDKLLTETLTLRRKLESFKICCDRVIIIEEERNAIVEQVYSLPVEERVNCNYLLEIQLEKAHLEKEIKRILEYQENGRHRIKELSVIEKILHSLQWELNSSYLQNDESCISKMLKKINSEAKVLLEMTKEQKRKFESDLSKTKYMGLDPNRVILFVKIATAAECDSKSQNDFNNLEIKSDEEIKFFEVLKTEMNATRKKMNHELDQVKKESGLLKTKLSKTVLENDRYKTVIESLQKEIQEIKKNRNNELQSLQQERDAYKSQVEDLEAIREAYSQLVEKQPTSKLIEQEFIEQINGQCNEILELEQIVKFQKDECKRLRLKVKGQKDQIQMLNKLINLTRPQKNKSSSSYSQSDSCCYKKSKILQKENKTVIKKYTIGINNNNNNNNNKRATENNISSAKKIKLTSCVNIKEKNYQEKYLRKITKQ